MKMKSKWLIALMALIMAFSMTACGGGGEEEAPAEEPAAAPSGDCWADQYVALIESGEARDFADYEGMAQDLIDVRDLSGATYVYVMSPGEEGTPVLSSEDTTDQAFLLTVEGSDDPDPWAEDYGWEVQFTEAWEGTPAAARSAWINDEVGDNHDICWSAFAPVTDDEGNVICILGIDYPCADVLNDYPEWNRDMDEWNGYEDEISEEVPADVQAVKDQALAEAEKYAAMLSHREVEITTDWGNQYVDLIESGMARDYLNYDHMKATLDAVREECGATYVYVLSPTEEEEILLASEDTSEQHFFITVDGSEDPDDWAVDYEWEVQFTEAWEGETAAARSAWINDEAGDNHDICWSVFAPIKDGEGNVVCILGIDYPCADILNDYPEWNRDMDEWNGYEDEIGEEVPADVQALIDEVKGYATKYAEMLSQAE